MRPIVGILLQEAMDMARKLILEKLAEKRLSMKDASLQMGHAHSYLYQFLKRGIPLELHERDRARLAIILGVDESQMRGPSTPLPKREYVKNSGGGTVDARNVTRFPGQPENMSDGRHIIQQASLYGGENDLPVFGTAQGGTGDLIVTDRAVDWVARPAPLMRVMDGYGIIITGDSMAPEHKNGSIALVNPHLPPRQGDTCVFRNHADDGTVKVIIKEMRGETESMWKVRQHNPKKDFVLKKSEWQVVHKTVGNYFA